MPHTHGKDTSSNCGRGVPCPKTGAGKNDPRFRSQFRKTDMCTFYLKGLCVKGSACNFAHGEEELSHAPDLTKTSLCREWLKFRCRKSGAECPFAHGAKELRSTEAYCLPKKPRKDQASDACSVQDDVAPPPMRPSSPTSDASTSAPGTPISMVSPSSRIAHWADALDDEEEPEVEVRKPSAPEKRRPAAKAKDTILKPLATCLATLPPPLPTTYVPAMEAPYTQYCLTDECYPLYESYEACGQWIQQPEPTCDWSASLMMQMPDPASSNLEAVLRAAMPQTYED